MNRRISLWSAFAATGVVAALGLTHSGSGAQTPPNPGNNAPGPGPGHRMGPPRGPGAHPGAPGQTMGQRPGGPGKGPGMGPGKRPGPMGGMKPPPGAPATPAVAIAPPAPPRVHHKGVDPFRIPWSVPPPPPYVFDEILPVRLAGPDIEPPIRQPITVREEPALRVSGIMTGDGVFAILEQSGGKVDIVKPGSSLDIGVANGSRTYRVSSIRDDTVTLESVEGNVTYQQIVPLSDAPVGTSASSFGAGGNGGPGRGGGFTPGSGGGPGRPGAPGGGRAPGVPK